MSDILPRWIDSHCHLDFDDFADEGVEALVERARLNNVMAMLTISTHISRLSRYLNLADTFPNIWTTIGVHPHQANEEGERDITVEQLIALANSHSKIVAIGECGLDYHYDFAPHNVQKSVFRTHIEAAIASDLPLIIHAREADEDMTNILAEAKAKERGLRGVMHCFSSSPDLARFALDLGFYISFSGMVTFPKAIEVQDICRSIPLDRLLVETDAPYLAPVHYRGKRNEPAYVSHTGRYVADLHNISEIDMARQTGENFYRLFDKVEKL